MLKSGSNCPTNPKSLTCHDGSWGSPVSDAPGCRIGCGTYMAALGYLSDCGGTVPFCTYYPTVKKCTKRVIQIGPVKTSDCGNCYGYTASDTFGCNYGCNSSCECSSAGEPTPTPGGPTTAPTNPPPVVPPTIPPASGFTASDGDYSNKVYLDWSPVVGAGGYGVYRRGADRRNRWLDAFRQSLPSNNSVL